MHLAGTTLDVVDELESESPTRTSTMTAKSTKSMMKTPPAARSSLASGVVRFHDDQIDSEVIRAKFLGSGGATPGPGRSYALPLKK